MTDQKNNLDTTANAEPTSYNPLRGDYADQWSHHDIGILIISSMEYIIYIDKEGCLDWETTPKYDKEIAGRTGYDLKKHNSILNDAAELETTPCNGFNLKTYHHFKRLIGEALACSFELDYAGARNMIVTARRFFQARSEETSRKWYLSSCAVITIPFVIAGFFIWIFRSSVICWAGETAFWLALATCFGTLGALFSVITRTGKLKFDCSAGIVLHCLEGSSRIIAGAISGLLVALAVKSEIILGPFAQGHHAHVVLILAALAAGTGERLATSIISKFDATHANMSGAHFENSKEKQEQKK